TANDIDFDNLMTKLRPVLQSQKYRLFPKQQHYQNNGGRIALIISSYPSNVDFANDTCEMSVDYFTSQYIIYHPGAPVYSYSFFCRKPARDVPKGFTYNNGVRLL